MAWEADICHSKPGVMYRKEIVEAMEGRDRSYQELLPASILTPDLRCNASRRTASLCEHPYDAVAGAFDIAQDKARDLPSYHQALHGNACREGRGLADRRQRQDREEWHSSERVNRRSGNNSMR